MGEIWEKAVERAIYGQKDDVVESLTLDGAVKCVNGHIPVPGLLGKFKNLKELSLANIGLSTLEGFPNLPKLRKLYLSDNRIYGGLDFLYKAELQSLKHLDLSNNRIAKVTDLKPLESLKLEYLDLYKCPVTRLHDYRSDVFKLIKSLKYLDKMDCQEKEKQSDDDDDEEVDDEEEDDDDEDDGVDYDDESGEIVGNRTIGDDNDAGSDVDEADSDSEDEEELSVLNGVNRQANGHRDAGEGDGDDDDADEYEDNESDSEEEVDDDDHDGRGNDPVAYVHEIVASDEDGVENEDVDEEELDDEDEGRVKLPGAEIDGHDEGEDDAEDDNGETGEEYDEDVEADEQEDDRGSYLVKPVGNGDDEEILELEDDDLEEDDVDDDDAELLPLKRNREEEDDEASKLCKKAR